MKNFLKLAEFVIASSILILFAANSLLTQETSQIKPTELNKESDTTAQESYVSEVVLRAPWSTKSLLHGGEESPPGEFGLYSIVFPDSLREKLPDPPLPQGPTAFTVAPNGDIYITDPLNKRIQRFDANGNFISVIPIPHFEESKYVNSYAWEWSLICVDQNNNVYLLWWEDYTEQYLCQYDQQGKLLKTYPFFPEVRIGGAGKRLYSDHSNGLFFEYSRKLIDKSILSLKEWNLVKKPRFPFTFQIGTADRVFTSEEQKATLRKGVREIPNISELKQQAWKEPPGESWGPDIWNYDFIDEEGNLYHYWRTKEGITITKWYK